VEPLANCTLPLFHNCPTRTTTSTTTTSTNTSPNASTNAPDDHGGDDVEVGINTNTNTSTSTDAPDDHDGDNDVKVGVSSSIAPDDLPTREWRSSMDESNRSLAGENASASATAPSSSVPPDAPTRERGFQCKSSSTAGQDVSRPGAFHDGGTEAGSSVAPTREQGFNKDDYRRHRPGQTTSAAAPSSSVTSDVPSTRDWRSSRDEYDHKFAGETASATAPSSLAPPDAPTRE
jgi:hypothetical protein